MELARLRMPLGLALAFVVFIAVPASAQQPSTVNPNANAVQEQKLLQGLEKLDFGMPGVREAALA